MVQANSRGAAQSNFCEEETKNSGSSALAQGNDIVIYAKHVNARGKICCKTLDGTHRDNLVKMIFNRQMIDIPEDR